MEIHGDNPRFSSPRSTVQVHGLVRPECAQPRQMVFTSAISRPLQIVLSVGARWHGIIENRQI
jgi:hypothetical protein